MVIIDAQDFDQEPVAEILIPQRVPYGAQWKLDTRLNQEVIFGAQYATVWERNSDVIPDKIALICGNKEVTWREYDNRAARLATILSEADLEMILR